MPLNGDIVHDREEWIAVFQPSTNIGEMRAPLPGFLGQARFPAMLCGAVLFITPAPASIIQTLRSVPSRQGATWDDARPRSSALREQ